MAAFIGIDMSRKELLPPITFNSNSSKLKQNAVANYNSIREPTPPIRMPTPQKDQSCHQNSEKTDYEMQQETKVIVVDDTDDLKLDARSIYWACFFGELDKVKYGIEEKKVSPFIDCFLKRSFFTAAILGN